MLKIVVLFFLIVSSSVEAFTSYPTGCTTQGGRRYDYHYYPKQGILIATRPSWLCATKESETTSTTTTESTTATSSTYTSSNTLEPQQQTSSSSSSSTTIATSSDGLPWWWEYIWKLDVMKRGEEGKEIIFGDSAHVLRTNIEQIYGGYPSLDGCPLAEGVLTDIADGTMFVGLQRYYNTYGSPVCNTIYIYIFY